MPTYNAQYIEKWTAYLNDTDRELSRLAAEKLGMTKSTDVVPSLVKALKNRPDDIRIAAARALGVIGDRMAVPALISLLGDPNSLVASTAADALGEIADPSAVPALTQVLRDYKSTSNRHFQVHGSNRGVYMAAVYALQHINTPQARKALEQYYR